MSKIRDWSYRSIYRLKLSIGADEVVVPRLTGTSRSADTRLH